MDKSELKPVFVDRQNLESALHRYRDGAAHLQRFIDMYRALNIGDLVKDDLALMLNEPKAFFVNKISGDKSFNFQGLKLNSDKLYDLVEKPKGLDELLMLIEKHNTDRNLRDMVSLQDYEISENNQVIVCQSRVETLTVLNSVYLTNDNQTHAHNALLAIAENLEILRNACGGYLDLDSLKNYFKRVAVTGETNSHRWGFALNYEKFKSIK